MREPLGQTCVEILYTAGTTDQRPFTSSLKLPRVRSDPMREILSNARAKFYENGKEINPLAYEDKPCDVKVTLAIEGLVVGDNVNLQVKIHDANVRPKTYEHVRLVDLEW